MNSVSETNLARTATRTREQSRLAGERLYRFVADGVRSGRLRPGERLPTERALVERFDCARSAVRRALDRLEAEGLIVRQVGRGTEVASAQAAADAAADDDALGAGLSPAQLMEARVALEPAIVELVVRNASAADIARMRHCLARAERAGSIAEFEDWDDALHRALASATHNAFVIRVFELIGAARSQASWGRLKERSLTAERRLCYQREHRLLVEALEQRDERLARQRALEHLRHVRQNLLDA